MPGQVPGSGRSDIAEAVTATNSPTSPTVSPASLKPRLTSDVLACIRFLLVTGWLRAETPLPISACSRRQKGDLLQLRPPSPRRGEADSSDSPDYRGSVEPETPVSPDYPRWAGKSATPGSPAASSTAMGGAASVAPWPRSVGCAPSSRQTASPPLPPC